jgi:Na+-translocating ferredoxin:NAD+ oxidoreductase RnfG subunit
MKQRSHNFFNLLVGLSSVSMTCHAEIYLTQEQAVKSIFPDSKFQKETLELNKKEINLIEDNSGEKVRNSKAIIYKAKNKNTVFIDEVLGKHEYITYAVGVDSHGKVAGIEILEYRESYGQQVQGAAWRKQFVGKDKSSTLKLTKDIINISGATLSSAHVTAGVRRVLQTYAVIQARL